MISAIGWVGELIELCGGVDDICRAPQPCRARSQPSNLKEVIAADPDIIVASWCGKPVEIDTIRARPGFANVRALKVGQIHAIDSGLLLQPGPRVLEGGRALRRVFDAWRACIPAVVAFSVAHSFPKNPPPAPILLPTCPSKISPAPS